MTKRKKNGDGDYRRGPRHRWTDEDNVALLETIERMQGYKEALKERGQGGDYHFYDAVAGVLCAERGIQVTGRAVLSRVYDLKEKRVREEREAKSEVETGKVRTVAGYVDDRLAALLEPMDHLLQGLRHVIRRQAVINGKLNLILRYLDMDDEDLPVPTVPERHFEDVSCAEEGGGHEQHQHTN